MGERM